MTLSEVIREAVTDFAAKKIGHVVHGGPPPPDFNDHIAAAVAAHLTSDAAAERVAVFLAGDEASFSRQNPGREYWVDQARAAISAALGEHEGVGRG